MTQLSFGGAIEALKEGNKVAREGWNGKGMWLAYVNADSWASYVEALTKEPTQVTSGVFIGMKTAKNVFVPWLASQSDMLADDWLIVE